MPLTDVCVQSRNGCRLYIVRHATRANLSVHANFKHIQFHSSAFHKNPQFISKQKACITFLLVYNKRYGQQDK